MLVYLFYNIDKIIYKLIKTAVNKNVDGRINSTRAEQQFATLSLH